MVIALTDLIRVSAPMNMRAFSASRRSHCRSEERPSAVMIVKTGSIRDIPVYLGVGLWPLGVTLAWWSRKRDKFIILTIGNAQLWK